MNPPVSALPKIQFKVEYSGILRRFATTSLSYQVVLQRICELYRLDKASVILQYKDEEQDLITFSTDEELREAFEQTDKAPFRLFVCSCSPLRTSATAFDAAYLARKDYAELKAQKKALKKEKKVEKKEIKLAKEQLKEAKKIAKEDLKRRYEAKTGPQSTGGNEGKGNDSPMHTRPPTAWMEQRQAMRQQQQQKQQATQTLDHQQKKFMTKTPNLPSPNAATTSTITSTTDKTLIKARSQQTAVVPRNLRARFVKHVTIPGR